MSLSGTSVPFDFFRVIRGKISFIHESHERRKQNSDANESELLKCQQNLVISNYYATNS